jgi:hypothetical protein
MWYTLCREKARYYPHNLLFYDTFQYYLLVSALSQDYQPYTLPSVRIQGRQFTPKLRHISTWPQFIISEGWSRRDQPPRCTNKLKSTYLIRSLLSTIFRRSARSVYLARLLVRVPEINPRHCCSSYMIKPAMLHIFERNVRIMLAGKPRLTGIDLCGP